MKVFKKLLSSILCFTLTLCCFTLPVKADIIDPKPNSVAQNLPTDTIELGVLPEDGSPLIVKYPVSTSGNSVEYKNSQYIIFSITRFVVNWSCVNVPADRVFQGTASTTNITSGFFGGNFSMVGRSGSFPYNSIPGHSYYMHFGGWMWRTSNGSYVERLTNESGGHTWTVPVN